LSSDTDLEACRVVMSNAFCGFMPLSHVLQQNCTISVHTGVSTTQVLSMNLTAGFCHHGYGTFVSIRADYP